MRTIFYLCSAGNFLAAALTGNIANLSVGCSLLALGLLWSDETELDTDEA
jgi:hypothetical protein